MRGESASLSQALTSKSVVSTLVDYLENSVEDEPLDIETLYARTKERSGDTDANAETVTNDAIVLNQVKKLLQRLVPYANQAPGTPMHVNFARKNMLSMVTSSVIVNHACWRWFLTFAFADLHESRLFEIIMPMIDQVLCVHTIKRREQSFYASILRWWREFLMKSKNVSGNIYCVVRIIR